MQSEDKLYACWAFVAAVAVVCLLKGCEAVTSAETEQTKALYASPGFRRVVVEAK
jgi:hypothetical protein